MKKIALTLATLVLVGGLFAQTAPKAVATKVPVSKTAKAAPAKKAVKKTPVKKAVSKKAPAKAAVNTAPVVK